MSELPLKGVRVLDVSAVLAAPVTSTFLGDFGAEVVKIEEPGVGDFTRGRATTPGGRSPQWLQEARNKKSVTLNLRSREGQDLLKQMIPHFDVMVTNYRPPTLERWGMGPEALEALNPQGIFVFITGYGLTGPYAGRGSFDRIASSFSGLTYTSGEADGDPIRCGYAVVDFMSAYLAAFSVVTALYHRDMRGGSGQVIDLALYEGGLRATEESVIDYSLTGAIRGRTGNSSPFMVPASDFTTADNRRISLHAATDTLFRKLAGLMQCKEFLEDDRYATRSSRMEHPNEIYGKIADWIARYDADDVVTMLNDAGVPASPVMNMADLFRDPHIAARGNLLAVEDEEFGPVQMVAPIPKLSKTPGRVRSLGPKLGAHNEEILSGLLGLEADEIAALAAKGVV